MAYYKVINMTTGDLVLDDGLVIPQNSYIELDELSETIISELSTGRITINPTINTGGLKLTDNTGGTAAVDGVVPSIASIADCADAIATLIAAIEANRWK